MNVGIIGCGVIGRKRAASLGCHKLKAVADINLQKAYDIAMEYDGIKVFTDYKELLKEPIDIVIVSTTNNMLAKIALDVINAGKHALIEKPAAIHYSDLNELIDRTEENNVKVKVGYNLRYHKAIYKAKEMVDAGDIGELMFVRGHYGHGARKGYEKEWRANKSLSGGGELLDQGVHLIDLASCFLGELLLIHGSVKTYFWNMLVEDNAFMMLENNDGKTAFLSVSCTEWKNTFSFEIYGTTGKLKIDGLGKSYGIEKLTYYKMSPEMGVPETIIWEYPKEDDSMEFEFMSFVHSINYDIHGWSDLNEARKILEIVDKIYEENHV